MNVVIIFSIAIVGLLIATIMTGRRFGLLGLALSAGAIISATWGQELASWLISLKIVPADPTIVAAILSLLVLLPAMLLLFHGPAYRTLLGRVLGGVLVTILATAFLVAPLGHTIVLEGTGAAVYEWMSANTTLVIGVGMIVAVLDLLVSGPKKPRPTGKSKH